MGNKSMDAPRQQIDSLPDVANDPHSGKPVALSWVGMQGIDVPLHMPNDPSCLRCASGKVDVWVNLPIRAKRGIHMSRLYAEVEQVLSREPLRRVTFERLLRNFLASHDGISDQARLRLHFDLLAKRAALLSDRSGWKSYPCRIEAWMRGERMCLELTVNIGYSSTCPASAALSRQLQQQAFARQFADDAVERDAVYKWLGTEQGMPATPHGQRSAAHVRVLLADTGELPLPDLLDQVEAALSTPLQTAVKRRDEQEFARLNGENLMFCEDAARRVHAALDADERYRDFSIRCEHYESLHPHDAVAMAVKGVEGGYGSQEWPG